MLHTDVLCPLSGTLQNIITINIKHEHQQKYSEGILQSINDFNRLLNKIKQRGLFKSTLFIFVSDHGELLGDRGGIWGYGNAITPELVEVPMVFIGDGPPGGEEYAQLLSGLIPLPQYYRFMIMQFYLIYRVQTYSVVFRRKRGEFGRSYGTEKYWIE